MTNRTIVPCPGRASSIGSEAVQNKYNSIYLAAISSAETIIKNIVMIKYFMLIAFCFTSFIGHSQKNEKAGNIKRNKKGIVRSVEFSATLKDSSRPQSAKSFFDNYLEAKPQDHFEKKNHKSKRSNFIHEHYDQYYQGVKVDGAGYNIHYKNGKIYFANGNYVKIDALNTEPSISIESAINKFIEFKGIKKHTVIDSKTELYIKEISISGHPDLMPKVLLVYRIYLMSDDLNNNEIGYVHAQTGEIVLTEPTIINLEGTFATRYSGSQQAATSPINGGHRLFDNTRGATIHTQNLQNNSIDFSDGIEIIDNNNNWTAAEHHASNNDMGLDVHWALQEIYDYFNVEHQINSFDDEGHPIEAFVRFGDTRDLDRDNAHWNRVEKVLAFGQGADTFRPLGSLDVVAHEYGHAITQFQIGWGNKERAFNEGLSDIWGAILESHIRPGNNIWQIGEQLMLNSTSLRNLETPGDLTAESQMSDTFEDSDYNRNSHPYFRSGVFSHWFYLLVNGGQGTNGLGISYSVEPINMELAENILIEAVFNNYLNGTSTYPEIRTALINAAASLYNNENIIKSVTNAWYAVGVGAAYDGTAATIVGSSTICTSNQTYSVNNLPAGSQILSWTASPANLFTVDSGTGSSFTTRIYNNGTRESGLITANISSPEGIIHISLGVWLGNPKTHNSQIQGTFDQVDKYSYDQLQVDASSGATSYHWVIVDDTNNCQGPYSGPVFIDNNSSTDVTTSSRYMGIKYGSCSGTYRIRCNAINACGLASYSDRIVTVSSGGGGSGGGDPCTYNLIAYPNPSDGDITIYLKAPAPIDPCVQFANDNTNDVEIYDEKGKLIHVKKYKNDKIKLKKYFSKRGMYELKVIDKNGDSHQKTIIIE